MVIAFIDTFRTLAKTCKSCEKLNYLVDGFQRFIGCTYFVRQLPYLLPFCSYANSSSRKPDEQLNPIVEYSRFQVFTSLHRPHRYWYCEAGFPQ